MMSLNRNRTEQARVQHGVVSRSPFGLVLIHIVNNTWIEQPLHSGETLGDLCQVAIDRNLTHLWVLPETTIIADRPFFDAATGEWDLYDNWTFPPGRKTPPRRANLLATASGFRRSEKGGQARVSVIFPANAHKPWYWVRRVKSARQALLTILYLEMALDIPVTASASTAGMRLLEKIQLDYKHPEWIAAPELDWSTFPFRWRDTSTDIIWSRPLSEKELPKRYLHKIDKNGAYLRACAAEKFGVGAPIHMTECAEREKRPGVWRCTFDAVALPGLPPVWDDGPWIVTPILQALRKTGHHVTVHEGYVWNEAQSHEILKHWAEDLWAVRQGFRQGKYKDQVWKSAEVSRLAEDACKQIATATVGLTSYGKFDEETFKYRPDWKALIIGAVRATMFYNMLKLQQETGLTPIIVYMDALYVVSDEPETETALATLLDKPNSLGGYKVGWARPIEVTADVRALLYDPVVSLSQKLAALNKIAAEGEKHGIR